MAYRNVVKITFLTWRNPEVLEQDFLDYWSKVHAPALLHIMKKHGVIEYRQVGPLFYSYQDLSLSESSSI
jgi:hypothetical protein